MKKWSKPIALLFFLVVYSASIAIGILTADLLLGPNPSFWVHALVLDVVATLLVWGVGLVIKNASIYDPYWSVFPPVLLIYWMISGQVALNAMNGVLIFAVLVWSVRLTYNFIINFDGFSYIDWRYVMLKEKNPKIWFVTNLFGINLMPTLIVLIQLLSAHVVINSASGVGAVFLFGAFISIVAAGVQFVSDKQMKDFRNDHAKKKAVMRDGLWAYSRHPNYLGEVSFWWGVWIMSAASVGKIGLEVIAPILMTMLFVFISAPMMEKKILSTRPEYTGIQKEIGMLLPKFFKGRQGSSDMEHKSSDVSK